MSECTHDCSSCGESCGERAQPQDLRKPANAHSHIKKVIAVASGKGGVGKSAVACTLAAAMAARGKKVGILDADITGPSVPQAFNIHRRALGVLFIPSFARLVRGEFLQYRDRDFVRSARLMGVGDLRIIFVHILPNTWPTLLSGLTIGFNNAVLAEASMSYLGIGVSPTEPSLGYMLKDAQGSLFTLPWCTAFPAAVVILLILGVSLVGEGVRERMGVAS